MEDYKKFGLDKDDAIASLEVLKVMAENPVGMDRVIFMSGQNPDPDPEVKFLQILQAAAVNEEQFNSNVRVVSEELNFSLGKFLAKVGGLVKKVSKSGVGKKIGKFVKAAASGVFKGLKKKGEKMLTPEELVDEAQEKGALTEAERKAKYPYIKEGEELDAYKTRIEGLAKNLKMATIGLGVAVLGLIGWIAFK